MSTTLAAAFLAAAAIWVAVSDGGASGRLGRLGLPTRSSGRPPRSAGVNRVATGSDGLLGHNGPGRNRFSWRAREGASRWRPGDRAARRAAREAATIELCRSTAAELRAGHPADTALALAIEPLLVHRRGAPAAEGALVPMLNRILADTAAGLPVATALRSVSTAPGAVVLERAAVCWEVGGGTGAGLAAALERLAAGSAEEAALRHELAAQLAGPRTTARLLLALPLVGLALGTGLGADPVSALVSTQWGRLCLGGAAALDVLGWWWTRRLAAAVLMA